MLISEIWLILKSVILAPITVTLTVGAVFYIWLLHYVAHYKRKPIKPKKKTKKSTKSVYRRPKPAPQEKELDPNEEYV